MKRNLSGKDLNKAGRKEDKPDVSVLAQHSTQWSKAPNKECSKKAENVGLLTHALLSHALCLPLTQP